MFADHYEPLLASKRVQEDGAEPYIVLDDLLHTEQQHLDRVELRVGTGLMVCRHWQHL